MAPDNRGTDQYKGILYDIDIPWPNGNLMKLIKDCQFIAFDFETTGITSGVDRVIEIGAVRFSLAEPTIDTFESLVYTDKPISSSASAVHGLSFDDLEDAPTMQEVLPAFLRFLGDDAILLAHNASFDRSFLAAECDLCRLPSPGNQVLCTLPFCKAVWPESDNYRLETIGRMLGLIANEEHRGLADSLLLRDVFLRGITESGISELNDLLSQYKPHQMKTVAEVSFSATSHVASEEVRLIEKAISSNRDIAIQYGEHSRSFRTVTPESCFSRGPKQYMVAICHREGISKTFRIDRIQECYLVME